MHTHIHTPRELARSQVQSLRKEGFILEASFHPRKPSKKKSETRKRSLAIFLILCLFWQQFGVHEALAATSKKKYIYVRSNAIIDDSWIGTPIKAGTKVKPTGETLVSDGSWILPGKTPKKTNTGEVLNSAPSVEDTNVVNNGTLPIQHIAANYVTPNGTSYYAIPGNNGPQSTSTSGDSNIGGNANVGGSVSVGGNLSVSGTTTLKSANTRAVKVLGQDTNGTVTEVTLGSGINLSGGVLSVDAGGLTQNISASGITAGSVVVQTGSMSSLSSQTGTITNLFSDMITAVRGVFDEVITNILRATTAVIENIFSKNISTENLTATGITTLSTANISTLNTSNTLTQSGNTLTSNVGGSIATGTIIGSHSITLSGNVLQSEVNGVLDIASLTSDNIAEGSNLFWTNTRFDTALSTKTTTNLVEGSNLYFTPIRAQSALSGSLATITSDISSLSGSINTLSIELSALSGTLASQYATLSGSLASTNTNLGTLSGIVNTLGSSLVSLSGTVNTLSSSLTSLSGGLATTNTSLSALTSTVNTLSGSVSSISTNVSTLNNQVSSLSGGLSSAETRISTLSGAIATLQSQISTLQSQAINLGTTNGLSLTGNTLSLGLASTSTTGALSMTDWNVFNNKINLSSLSAGSGVTYNAITGRFGWNGTTSDVIEGTNLYFTNTRAQNALSGTITSINGNLATATGNILSLQNNLFTATGNIATLSTNVGTLSGNLLSLSGNVASLSGVVNGLLGNVASLSGNITTLSGLLSTANSNIFSLSGGLNTLSGNLSSLSGNLSILSGNFNTLSGGVSSLSGRVNTLSGSVSTLFTSLAATNGNIATLSGNLSSLSGTVNLLSGNFNTLSGGVSTLSGRVNTLSGTVSGLSTSFNTLSGNLLSLSGSVASLSGVVGTHTTQISGISGQIFTLTGNVANLFSGLATATGNIVSLQNNLFTATGNIASINSNLFTATGNIATLSTNVGTLSGNLLSLSGSVASLSGNISSLSGLLSTANSNIFSLSGGLNTLSGNLSSLSGNLSILSGNFNTLSGGVSTLSGRVNTLSGTVSGLSTSFNTLSGNLLSLSGSVASLSGVVGTHTTQISGISGQIFTLTGNVANLFSGLATATGNIVSLQNNLFTATGNIATLSTSVGTLSGNLLSLSGSVASLSGNISSLSGLLSTANSNIFSLSGGLNTLSGNLSSLSGTVNLLSGNLSSLSGNLSILSGNFNTLSGGVSTLSGRVNTLSGSVSTLFTSLAATNGSLATLSGGLSSLSGNLSSLSGTVNLLSGNFNTLSGGVSTLSGRVNTLSGTVSGLSTSFNTLSGNLLSLSGVVATKIGLTSLSANGPLTYNNSTGVFGINIANSTTTGALSMSDWNLFNGKENTLTFNNGLSRVGNTVSIGTLTGGMMSGFSVGQLAFGSASGGLTQSGNLFWDNVNGRLGIGTNSPAYNLHITGNALLGNGTLTNIPAAPFNLVNSSVGTLKTQLNLINTGGGGGAGSAIDFYTYDVSGGSLPGLRIGAMDNNFSADFIITSKIPGAATNALVEKFRITNIGNVGIGTQAPNAKLEVNSGTGGLSGLRFTQLTSASIASLGNGKILSLNGSGDVILTTGENILSIGTPANGLSMSGTSLSVAIASGTSTGVLTPGDWNSFNNKINTLSGNLATTNASLTTLTTNVGTLSGNLLSLSGSVASLSGVVGTKIGLSSLSANGPLTYNNSTGVFGINIANSTTTGALSMSDWNLFNGKESVLTFGNGLSRVGNTVSIGTLTGGMMSGFSAGQLAFGSASGGLTQSGNLFWDNVNGRLGIGTNAPLKGMHVQQGGTSLLTNAFGDGLLFSTNNIAGARIMLENINGGLNTKTVSIVNEQNRLYFGVPTDNGGAWVNQNMFVMNLADQNIGIGTANPSAKLHVSDNLITTGSLMMISGTNTTTGHLLQITGSGGRNLMRIAQNGADPLDIQRVTLGQGGISASKPDAIGTRDQLYVFGRINTSWDMAWYDFLGGNVANITTDTNIGDGLTFDPIVGATYTIASSAGLSGIGQIALAGAANNGGFFGSAGGTPTERSLNPVFETRVQLSQNTNVRSIVGFADRTINAGVTVDANNYTNEAFFRKTAGGLVWTAVTRSAGGVETITTLAQNPTTMSIMRIEIDNSGAGAVRFYINGTLVATHTTNIPLATARLGYHVGATLAGANATNILVDYIRVWSDDPPGSTPPTASSASTQNILLQQNIAGTYASKGVLQELDTVLESITQPFTLSGASIFEEKGEYEKSEYASYYLSLTKKSLEKMSGTWIDGDIGFNSLKTRTTETSKLCIDGVCYGSGELASKSDITEALGKITPTAPTIENFYTSETTIIENPIHQFTMIGTGTTAPQIIETIKNESPKNGFEHISMKVGELIDIIEEIVVGRIIAIRGYFDTIFARETHTETLCVGKSGDETCITKDELDGLIEMAKILKEQQATTVPVQGTTPPSPPTSTEPTPEPIETEEVPTVETITEPEVGTESGVTEPTPIENSVPEIPVSEAPTASSAPETPSPVISGEVL